ncbi:NAD(P)-dependent dehydrogenase (short-subunit alcohol dehydrogenase family) [Catenulispora sp. GP43]|uniref:SDR family oxidoreductase n=1 Tax=Catenulispora sp. GP43 TaxID=3156263 RepID=UPI003514B8C8
MEINGSIALVTGANRGLGRAFTAHLLDRGAAKVYAAARRPADMSLDGLDADRVVRLALDVTDPDAVRRAAEQAPDVTLLVNNAGSNTWQDLVAGDLDRIRLELETHLFGSLHMVRAFAPALGGNGGGAVVNVLSAMSWFAHPGANAYHVAKAAAWAMANGVRLELAGQGTLVTAVHLGLADTDMSAGFDSEKLPPLEVARAALDGVEAGAWEVLVDEWSRSVKASLAADPHPFYEALAAATF